MTCDDVCDAITEPSDGVLYVAHIDRKRKILTLSKSLPKVAGDFRLTLQEWAKWYIQVKP